MTQELQFKDFKDFSQKYVWKMKFSVVLFLRVLLSDVDLNTKLSRLNAKYICCLNMTNTFFLTLGPHFFALCTNNVHV